MTKKTINQLSDKELHELLQSSPQIPVENSFNYPNDIMDFISFYNLKPGEENIPLRVLYKVYNKWSETPLKRSQFSEHIGRFFVTKAFGNGNSVVCLDKNAKQFQKIIQEFFKKMDKTKKKGYKKHFDSFLNFYNISPGTLYLKDKVLYDLYDKWTYKNQNYNPLSFNQFLGFLRLYFKKDEKYIAGNYYFSLDATIVNHLSEDMINEMKKRYEKTQEKSKV